MEKQLQVKENTLNDEVEQTLRQFVHFGLDKGLSVKESCGLIEELLELVTHDRGHEWIDIAEAAIHKANNN